MEETPDLGQESLNDCSLWNLLLDGLKVTESINVFHYIDLSNVRLLLFARERRSNGIPQCHFAATVIFRCVDFRKQNFPIFFDIFCVMD